MRSLFVLVLAITYVASKHDPGLRVKFNFGLRPGKDFFFDVPRSIDQAVLSRWIFTSRPEGPLPSLSLYCHSDLTLCAFFDDNGSVSGLQIALNQEEFTDNIYNMTITGFKEWVVTSNDDRIRKFWAIAMYFVSEDYLKLPVSERQVNYDNSKLLQEDAVWVTGFNGVVDKISAKDSEIQKSIFTRQACIPWMGQHYYYNMKKNTECRADTMYPWFPLTDFGDVIALGLAVIGKYPVKSSRDWFEHPPKLAVSIIVPRGPDCLYELASKPGITTMHVYFINKPWHIVCPLFKK